MNNSHRNAALKALVSTRQTIAAPAAFDCLSAKLVEEAGFDVVYIGSYGTSASAFGLPDTGLLSIGELAHHARRVAASVQVPVIADAEAGTDDPANMWRVVREFEDAGVSAIHIEDHAGGKHTGTPASLVPLDLMVERLRAALAARRDRNFQIIARTDAISVGRGLDEALRRVRAFAELGVDMIFPSGLDIKAAGIIRGALPVPMVVTETPTGPKFAAEGAADLVIHYGFCLYAASKGVGDALRVYRDGLSSERARRHMESVPAFEARLGYPPMEHGMEQELKQEVSVPQAAL